MAILPAPWFVAEEFCRNGRRGEAARRPVPMEKDKSMNKELFDKGMKIRRATLGDAYVDRALGRMNDFNKPMQELVTEYCWGEVWGREGLSRRDRSMINIAMIAILNRHNELKGHLRGALNNGLTREEIAE